MGWFNHQPSKPSKLFYSQSAKRWQPWLPGDGVFLSENGGWNLDFFPPKNTSEDQPCLPKKRPSLKGKNPLQIIIFQGLSLSFEGVFTTTVEIVSENSRVYQEVAKSHYLCSFYLLMCFVSLRRYKKVCTIYTHVVLTFCLSLTIFDKHWQCSSWWGLERLWGMLTLLRKCLVDVKMHETGRLGKSATR